MISRFVALPVDFALMSLAHQDERGLEAVVNFKFVENIGEVCLNRLFADEDFLADFFIGQPLGDQFEDFQLAPGERAYAVVDLCGCLGRWRLGLDNLFEGLPGRNLFVDPNASVVDAPNRLQESGGRNAFGYVTSGAALGSVEHIFFL